LQQKCQVNPILHFHHIGDYVTNLSKWNGYGESRGAKTSITNISMPNETVVNEQVKACKGKNLAQEFDVSGALDGPMKSKDQNNGESFDCIIPIIG
jgi:hypothetical protein